jgi:hypothetical protein
MVEQHNIESLDSSCDRGDRRPAVLGCHDAHAAIEQRLGDRPSDQPLIVDDQHIESMEVGVRCAHSARRRSGFREAQAFHTQARFKK